MKKFLPSLLCFFAVSFSSAQVNLDTLALQDFEITPAVPTWNFTGPVIYNSGYSSAAAAPPNSPLGINGSRAWETTVNSGGLILEFSNVNIPAGYDTIRVHFNLAAMDLTANTGGPDNLDYVLVQVSTDGGTTYYNRMRIRGAVNNNSYWPYSATGVAKLFYQPQTETTFQPVNSGLATTLGYSNCEITFPGSVTQVRVKITGRSSSSSDTWLVDNVIITGENNCVNSSATINPAVCNSYISPSGNVFTATGVYQDTIPNQQGCDSLITINLTVNETPYDTLTMDVCDGMNSFSGNAFWSASGIYNDTLVAGSGCDSIITCNLTVRNSSNATITPAVCGSYTSPSGNNTWTVSGTYNDVIPNAAGCDSTITINLTILQPSFATLTVSGCGSYTAPSGTVYTSSGVYADTLTNQAGCDSILTLNVTIGSVDATVSHAGNTLAAFQAGAIYQWVDCDNNYSVVAGATSQFFTPAVNGNYALIVTFDGCTDTSVCNQVTLTDVLPGVMENIFVAAPNPTGGLTELLAVSPLQGAVVQLVDLQGRILWTAENVSGNRVQVDLSAAPAGIYLLRVSDATGLVQLRVVRQ